MAKVTTETLMDGCKLLGIPVHAPETITRMIDRIEQKLKEDPSYGKGACKACESWITSSVLVCPFCGTRVQRSEFSSRCNADLEAMFPIARSVMRAVFERNAEAKLQYTSKLGVAVSDWLGGFSSLESVKLEDVMSLADSLMQEVFQLGVEDSEPIE